MKREDRKPFAASLDVGFGGLLKGVADLIENLGALAEAGAELSSARESGEYRAIYGLNVRFANGGPHEGGEIKVEPFGTVVPGPGPGPAEGPWREPIADVFEEADHALIVAELPGIDAQDLQVSVDGQQLHLSADRGPFKYRKAIDLPAGCGGTPQVTANNGIFEIRLPRTSQG